MWVIVRSCRRAPRTAVLLLWAWVWYCPTINREPTQRSRLTEHALHPGAVVARLGSKQRPRAARAEAARAGRWWPWLDSNGVTFFVQQHDRGSWCRLQPQHYEWLLYKYLVPGTCGLRIIRKKWNACFYLEPPRRFYTRIRKFNEVTNRRGKRFHCWTSNNLAQ